MTNTYAINATRGKEFEVERQIADLGLHPWLPRQLCCKSIPGADGVRWYERPYIGKLLFCVIPAVYWSDVVKIKHIIGKPIELTRMQIDGVPAHVNKATGKHVPAVVGLRTFQEAVAAEFAEMERKKANSEYVCQFVPGQAVELLVGEDDVILGTFKGTIRRAYDEYHKMQVQAEIMGRVTTIEVDADHLRESS